MDRDNDGLLKRAELEELFEIYDKNKILSHEVLDEVLKNVPDKNGTTQMNIDDFLKMLAYKLNKERSTK
jgi:Ca2+-binding EF-hand superfamily protein